jgi:hypothetical protein
MAPRIDIVAEEYTPFTLYDKAPIGDKPVPKTDTLAQPKLVPPHPEGTQGAHQNFSNFRTQALDFHGAIFAARARSSLGVIDVELPLTMFRA